MALPPLLIRNLTSNTIEIKHCEVHDTLGSSGRFNVTSFWNRSATAKSPQSTLEDISVPVKPFEVCSVEIRTAVVPPSSLSIYLEIEGELYQADMLQVAPNIQSLVPLTRTENPSHEYSSIYHPLQHHLAIIYHRSANAWMRNIEDSTSLSALSIPGTHNSPTYHRALPSVRCQAVPVREQLLHGVRFLDVRVQPESPLEPSKDNLILVHSVFPVSLKGKRYFRPLLNEIIEFLEQNPSETIIISIKREGPGNATDAQLSRILYEHYTTNVNNWFTAPRIPLLGEARGKIILVRRFTLEERLKNEWGGKGWGINADSWADNSPHSLCPSGDICIQDVYEIMETDSVEKKINYVVEHLERASKSICLAPAANESEKPPFYINFLTASNFWKQSCWPDRVAARLNPAIVEYLCLRHAAPKDGCDVGYGATGIVVCDWVGQGQDWSIVQAVVSMNSRFHITNL